MNVDALTVYYSCLIEARINAEQEFFGGRGDLTEVSFVSERPLNESVFDGIFIPTIQAFVISFDTISE